MAMKLGHICSGIRTEQGLKDRCRIDEDTGCWHWAMAINQGSPRVHIVLDGKSMVCRGRGAALAIRRGELLPAGHCAYAVIGCKSADCVNPEHCRSGTRMQHGKYLKATGLGQTHVKRSVAAKTARLNRAKLDMDKVRAIRRSTDRHEVEAAKHGVSESCIRGVRAGTSWREHLPAASVFTFRGAA